MTLQATTHSAEFDLLLCCCRPTPSPDDYLRQQQLLPRVDHDLLLALALRHKIAPLLFSNLRTHPVASVDAGLMARLQSIHARNKSKALQAWLLTRQLADRDIKVCTLKGLDVALRAYGDLGVRHVGDIDLLVDQAQLPQAAQHLQALGWHTAIPELLAPHPGQLLQQYQCDCLFERAGYPDIELHWRANFDPNQFAIGPLANYPVSAQVQAGNVQLDNEDLLIYLCLHADKHGWYRLKWLFDLPNVIERLPLDWGKLWQRARQLKAELSVRQGLLMAERYCRIPLPAEAKAGLGRTTLLHAESIARFLQWPEAWVSQPDLPQRLQLVRYRARTTASWRSRLWHIGIFLHPNYRDYRSLKLSPRLAWLYLPLHPWLWLYRKCQPS